jgi:hypothetical protein
MDRDDALRSESRRVERDPVELLFAEGGRERMAGSKKCPKCRLVNPALALRCDCGYDFVSRSVEASYLGGRAPDAVDATRIEQVISFLFPYIGFLLGIVARSNGRTRASDKIFFVCILSFIFQVIGAIVIAIVISLSYSFFK